MKKDENLTQEVRQLLRPIKERPDLVPNQEFVNELHYELIMEGKKKKTRKKLVPLFATAAIFIILPLLILSSLNESEDIQSFAIKESSHIQLVDTIKYGTEKGEVSLNISGMNRVSSFDIKQGTLYLLIDGYNSHVLIKSNDGTNKSFPVSDNQNIIGDLDDILVTEDAEIYILNSMDMIVHHYQSDGELLSTYDLSKLDIYPDSLVEMPNNKIMVSQEQEKFVDLKTLRLIDDEQLPFYFKQVNRKEAILTTNDESGRNELSLYSDFTLSNLAVLDILDKQIIYIESVTPPVKGPISETHVFMLDKNGTKIGGVRIPEENFIENHQSVENYIATDGNEIYLLIPESEHVALYKLTLGKEYESFIYEQVEEVDIGFDYQTFGAPFPELEEEIRKLFKTGTIKYGNEDSLNGVAIDEYGTVIVDFKDFLAGSPASAEAQPLFEALHSATFEKFPEIQQIYFQFDGSFSAWAHWLESTEEPWKRENSN